MGEKDLVPGNELVLTDSQLESLSMDYRALAKKALYDDSYESDLHAALYAPATFLKDPTNFEAAFDVVIYHLNEAHRKCKDETTLRIVARVADELFNNHIYVIQYRIDYALNENKKGFLKKISEFLAEVPKKLSINYVQTLIDAAPEIGKLSGAYFEYLSRRWMIKEKEQYFYNQLANVYQKILDAECFDPDIGLARNNYLRNKENILRYVVMQKGLVAATNLTKFDKSDSQVQDSARAISRALIETGQWDNLVEFLLMVKGKGIANLFELKKEAIEAYENFRRGEICGDDGIIDSGLKFVSKFIVSSLVSIISFFGAIYYRFTTEKIIVKGFWDSLLNVFSTSFSSLVLAIAFSIGAFIATYIIVSMLNTIINTIKRNSSSKKLALARVSFENRL